MEPEHFGVPALDETRRKAFSSFRRSAYSDTSIWPLAADRKLAEHGLCVRIGLHTGEAIREGEDFYGTSVITAARIAEKAEGGQILVWRCSAPSWDRCPGVELVMPGASSSKAYPDDSGYTRSTGTRRLRPTPRYPEWETYTTLFN